MLRALMLGALFGIELLTGCAHAPGGFLAKRTQDSYDVFVGGAIPGKEDSFYAGAYFTCLDNHKKGFEIKSRTSDAYGSIDATITCKGAPDKFLAEKYSNRKIQLEKNDIRYAGGFEYKVISVSPSK